MLTETERKVLAMAARTFRTPGAREDAVRRELRMSPTRYAQVLNALLDRREALEAAPVLINRLRGRRERLRAHRGD
ncbi:DUF3263 domain-containing protein [Mangrovactinospora gilvigrisea]|uniref:DUF3263 domain-containing protein n=1 Tax=Mangrovactinospora gilvigrisea TaxID=1428644 RepID=UPI001FEC0AD4|nr:DUF3263 domain-containing protein [Mangrovactinospora gilvigrisea]